MSHLGERLTALVDGRLTPAEQDRVLAHLRHCSACRAEFEHERWVAVRLRELPGAEPSAALLMALRRFGQDPVGEEAPVPLATDPAAHWRWPAPRRVAVALAGAGTVAAGVLGLAYVVGGAPAADPVRPPVEQFSAEFARGEEPLPFTEPASDVFPVLDPGGKLAGRP